MHCQSCGADSQGRVCAYCGALAQPAGDAADEKALLDELHQLISQKDDDKAEEKAQLLRNGFLPENVPVLVDAGLRCVPFLTASQADQAVPVAALRRLEAIVMKLRVLPQTPDVQRALAELEPRVRQQQVAEKRENRLSTILGCGCLIFLVLGIIGVALAMSGYEIDL